MIGEFRVYDPDSMVVTLTATMPLKEWKAIRADMDGSTAPALEFKRMVRELIEHATEHFDSVGECRP
jgi:hypothetical protein